MNNINQIAWDSENPEKKMDDLHIDTELVTQITWEQTEKIIENTSIPWNWTNWYWYN